jgi:hypothetical protein
MGPSWFVRGGQILGVCAIIVIVILWIASSH